MSKAILVSEHQPDKIDVIALEESVPKKRKLFI